MLEETVALLVSILRVYERERERAYTFVHVFIVFCLEMGPLESQTEKNIYTKTWANILTKNLPRKVSLLSPNLFPAFRQHIFA